MNRTERRKFAITREKEHLDRRKDFQTQPAPLLSESEGWYQCKNCKGGFVARKADRKRGWARFCDKSCKAQNQQDRMGQCRKYYALKNPFSSCRDDIEGTFHPHDSYSLGQE